MTDGAPKRSERVVAQHVQGEQVLLALDTGRYYTLNDVGSAVWGLCDGTRAVPSLVDAVCAEFDAPPEVVQSDVAVLVAELIDEGLLVEVG